MQQGRFLTLMKMVILTILLDNLHGIAFAKEIKNVEYGHNVVLNCLSSSANITWKQNNENISIQSQRVTMRVTVDDNTTYNHTLMIANLQLSDEGEYSCDPDKKINDSEDKYIILPFIKPSIVLSSDKKIKKRIGQGVELFCLIEAYPWNDTFKSNIKWMKDGLLAPFLAAYTNTVKLNETHVNVTLELTEVYKKENGTYSCLVPSAHEIYSIKRDFILLVMDVPQVSIDYVKAVGASKIFLNWTVSDGNDPVQKYFVQYMQEGAPTFTYYDHVIEGKNTSYVLENFLPNTSYLLRMSAKNSVGGGAHHQYHQPVRTLSTDPIFIPKVETTGSTASTITIGWSPPNPELLEYIQFYELVVSETGDQPKVIEEAIYQQNSRNLPYMFDNLKTATAYEFKVRSCSELTKLCGPWSEIVNGTTMDGVASKPTELQVICETHNVTRLNSVVISWNLPKIPNGKVVSYMIQLDGKSNYKVGGTLQEETWGPKIRRVDEPHHKTVYDGVHFNTNYSVSVSAITRHRKTGEPIVGNCMMPISVPETINRIMWTKIKTSDNKCVFKVFMPKISERNGPICCYRIYLVRMNNYDYELPQPQNLNISTYREVHKNSNIHGGAYIAEMFSEHNFKSVIFLGDGKRFFDDHDNKLEATDEACRKCLHGVDFIRKNTEKKSATLFQSLSTEAPQRELNTSRNGPELTQQEEIRKAGNLTEAASKILDSKNRMRRNPKVVGQNNLQELENTFDQSILNSNLTKDTGGNYLHTDEVFDGEIDINSNYTGFVEVIVFIYENAI